MAILSLTDQLTAIEVAKRSNISADARRVIEELAVTNEMLYDAPYVEANQGTADTHLVRTALPHGQRRAYNEGVGTASSQTKQITDVISNIEIYSEVDKQMVDESAHPTELMQSEQVAFIDGLGMDIADDLMYGSHDRDPRSTNGFAVRRSKIDDQYTIDMGGTGDSLTSLYLVKWGWDKCRIIYPRGAKSMGVQYNYLGEQTAMDEKGNKHQVYRAHYRVSNGLSVGNKASIIRLANIDLNSIDGAKLAEKIVRVKSRLAKGAGTVSILCNEEIKGIMNVAAINKSNIILQADDPWGHEILKIGDMRFRQCDSILCTEDQVTK